ncbi:NRAMP family divalent metal transporter [Conexivisphaera calida]|uniref:Manganese transport protein MntH n=1 Tax=Conexivisphaera calida TaxID=1874277 RepID=A0A4P2VD69_9ARCH|nr:divalent metal cation transporter [Conexivisphaera calida]BBE42539.1 Manganese transport protein MntH [Conexivisphaera calida]
MNAEGVARLMRAFGPAWLVMIADVDVASIVTGLQDGASWGYHMVFVMLILTVPLFFIQDAAGRLGTVSGMGLGRAIRERHGSRSIAIAALPMALTDFMTYVVEFAGIALGARLLGVSPALTVAVAFLAYAIIVATKRYRAAEAVLLPVSFMLVAAIVVSVAFFPVDPGRLLLEGLSPIQPYLSPGYGFLLAASIGAVIMPWMLFFHSGADARKGLSRADLPAERAETLVGAIVSEVLMAITVIDGYGLRLFDGTSTLSISPSEIASLLHPLGPISSLIMGVGFIAAGFLALTVASMASGWGFLAAVGSDSRRIGLAYYLIMGIAAASVAILETNLVSLMLDLMAAYTIVILPSLYYLGRLVSDPVIMRGHPLKSWERIVYWIMAALVFCVGLVGIILSL